MCYNSTFRKGKTMQLSEIDGIFYDYNKSNTSEAQ